MWKVCNDSGYLSQFGGFQVVHLVNHVTWCFIEDHVTLDPQIVTNGFYAWSNFEFVQFFFSLTFVSEDDIMRHSFRTKIEFERRSFFKYSVFRVRFPTRDEALSECSCCGRGPWCHKCQLSPKVHLEEDRWVVPRTTFDPSSSRDRLESIVVFNFICGWRVRGSQVTKVQVFLRRMTPECCVSTLESNVLGYWDGPKQFSWWPHRFMRGKWRDTCVLGVRWTSSHHQRGWRCQRKQMLSCRAARQQAPGVGTCRDGTRIQRKVHSSQSQPKGSHRRRSLANVERFQKDDVQLLEFWTVAVGPRLTMGFRDLDATKAVRDLRVSVRCNMTARTSACRIVSRKLCKQEPSCCAPEPKFVSSAWQLLFPCTEESQSIKICCVAGSRPRGGPVRRGRGCTKQGDAWRMVEETSTLSPRRRGKRAVLTKKKVHGHQARRDPWSTNRRETRLVVFNFIFNIVIFDFAHEIIISIDNIFGIFQMLWWSLSSDGWIVSRCCFMWFSTLNCRSFDPFLLFFYLWKWIRFHGSSWCGKIYHSGPFSFVEFQSRQFCDWMKRNVVRLTVQRFQDRSWKIFLFLMMNKQEHSSFSFFIDRIPFVSHIGPRKNYFVIFREFLQCSIVPTMWSKTHFLVQLLVPESYCGVVSVCLAFGICNSFPKYITSHDHFRSRQQFCVFFPVLFVLEKNDPRGVPSDKVDVARDFFQWWGRFSDVTRRAVVGETPVSMMWTRDDWDDHKLRFDKGSPSIDVSCT